MFTKDDVLKIAKLSKIRLTDAELEKFTTQLGSILDFFAQLQEVNTDNVEETSQVTGLTNVIEDDTIILCNHTNELLECSPHPIEQHSIKIPKIL